MSTTANVASNLLRLSKILEAVSGITVVVLVVFVVDVAGDGIGKDVDVDADGLSVRLKGCGERLVEFK